MASRSVNKVILIGHLGKDAETRFTPAGIAVTSFSVATNRRWKDQQTGEWKEETDWAKVVLWRQENLANYLTKGKQVYVEGRLQTRSYDDKEGKKHRLAFSFFIHLEKPIAMPQIRGQRIKQSNIQEPHRCDNNLSDSLLFHDTPRVALNLTASRSLMTA